jgi:hypothetical protein
MSGSEPEIGPLATVLNNQLSAGNNQHGPIKERFKLGTYYEKKLTQQNKFYDKQHQRTQRKKWKFSNSCKISLDSSCTLTASEIFDSIKLAFPNEELLGVDGIAQSASAKKWEIKLTNSAAFEAACKKVINIGGTEYKLTDANLADEASAYKSYSTTPFTMTTFFRIHWLPVRFEIKKVEEFLKEFSFLEILSIEYEKWSSSPLLNGVIKVKVKYQVESHQDFLDFAGLQNIDDYKALVQLCGMEPKCLFCKKFGHMRKKCPLAGKKCSKCLKNGHEAYECTFAKATTVQDQLEGMDEDELLDENASAPANNEKLYEPLSLNAEKSPINGWFEPLVSTGPNAALEFESNGDANSLNSASIDLEFIKSLPATSSAAQAVTANPEQTIEIKKENEQKATNQNFAIPSTEPRSSLASNKPKQVKPFVLKSTADIPIKDLKKPKGVAKKDWDKMTDVEKRSKVQAIAQAEFDATNLAAKKALASRSGSLKRQSSNANIDQEANKKAATTSDGQSASNSVNTDDALD